LQKYGRKEPNADRLCHLEDAPLSAMKRARGLTHLTLWAMLPR